MHLRSLVNGLIEASDSNRHRRICLHALETMQTRFPLISDFIPTLRKFTELEPHHLDNLSTVVRQNSSELDVQGRYGKIFGIFAAMYSFDNSLSVGGAVCKKDLPQLAVLPGMVSPSIPPDLFRMMETHIHATICSSLTYIMCKSLGFD